MQLMQLLYIRICAFIFRRYVRTQRKWINNIRGEK